MDENNINEKKPHGDDGTEEYYREKNSSIITPDSYYKDLTEDRSRQSEERYYEYFDKDKPKSVGWSIVSLVLGVVSVCYGFIGWLGLIIGIVAIVFAVVSRVSLGYFNGMSVAGLILGIFGVVFGAAVLIVSIVVETSPILGVFPTIGTYTAPLPSSDI